MRLCSALEHCGGGLLRGFALDETNLDARLIVEIRVDGVPVAATPARLFEPKAVDALPTCDGFHGFVVQIAPSVLAGAHVVEACIANSATSVGEPIALAESSSRQASSSDRGFVTWAGGRRLSGWLPPWVRSLERSR